MGISNLTRYDLDEIRGCGEYDHIITEQVDGEYVKFEDVAELLKQTNNSAMDAIAQIWKKYKGDAIGLHLALWDIFEQQHQ